ncbi:hypothetical protein AND_005123 [Anopheles darlingi]|uniref:CUB domain-containing protein n=1 Tax=Anopheles darlingi TaxID=43151 RepID=W5JJU0_ANODA|nr:hypothetical protein AND_005123 [Anopheles darlingi]
MRSAEKNMLTALDGAMRIGGIGRKHGPCRHLFFIYELLSGTRAHTGPEYVPARSLQLLLGIIDRVMESALATFLVAELSVPKVSFPVRSLQDLQSHPEYTVCVPLRLQYAHHIANLRSLGYRMNVDQECDRLIANGANATLLAEYLCAVNRNIVVLASEIILRRLFADAEYTSNMCKLIAVQKKVLTNWIAIPFGAQFRHAEPIKQFCSGKNHCSFIFAQDHPFAVVWKEGTVRIKYICMDGESLVSKQFLVKLLLLLLLMLMLLPMVNIFIRFRIYYRVSKYCGEHLIVRNEIRWEPLDDDYESSESDANDASTDTPTTLEPIQRTGPSMLDTLTPSRTSSDPPEPQQVAFVSIEDSVVHDSVAHGFAVTDGRQRDRRLTREDEPRAEALHAATVHSFHNLKILKPIEEPASVNDTDDRALELEAARNRNRQRQKVFSQDFRVLKILPSNLDVVEDIKQIGNEYYFKKDVEVLVDDNENAIVEHTDAERDRSAEAANGRQGVNYTATTSDGSEMTETLDIVVLPAPTKDIEIYENEVLPESESQSPDDLSVIGLITPTRLTPSISYTSSMATVSVELLSHPVTDSPPADPSSANPIVVDTTLGHWDEDRLVLPELEDSSELLSGQAKPNRTTNDDQDKFRFDNGTFRSIQETVRKELDESWDPIPSPENYDEDADDDEEDDEYESHPFGKGSMKFHKKYTSVQRTLLKRPLRQGFLMTPGYPKYYIGDSVCQWTLYAGLHQRIKLTVLDLALRHDDECRDYLHVVDLNTNHTLFHSCTESTRPIEIVSIQERLEVSVRTTTKVIYPKRGVLLHYTALGCEAPSPTPGRMKLVRRTEQKAKYVCDPLHVFPDTGESSRELICTAKHAWNRALPPCVEKRTTEGSGLVSHYEQKRRFGEIDRMSDNQADTVYDILIPSFVIAALFIVNGIVFAVIMRYRNKRKQRLDLETF